MRERLDKKVHRQLTSMEIAENNVREPQPEERTSPNDVHGDGRVRHARTPRQLTPAGMRSSSEAVERNAMAVKNPVHQLLPRRLSHWVTAHRLLT